MPGCLWWEGRSAGSRAPLDGGTTADVVIVGGGYTGLWTALHLLRETPLRVVILEAAFVGFGASGRNGGWCSGLFPASLDKLARMSNRTDAKRMQDAVHRSVDEVERALAEESIDADFARGGTITLARSDLQRRALEEEVGELHRWGYGTDDVRMLEAEETAGIVRATAVRGALYSRHCAAIHPAKLVTGLASAVESRGGIIHESTPALSIEPGVVRTPRGDVRAPYVVRATEGFTPRLPGLKRVLAPVYSLMIATEPLPEKVWDEIGLAERTTFTDGRHLIIYGQRTADGRLAFGGRGAPYHFGSAVRPELDSEHDVHEALHRELLGLFPLLEPFRVTHRWGGPLGVPRDWMPSCGLDPRTGMAWSGGYVGDGVATSNLGGRTVADLILGRDTDLVSLPWVNHRSPKWEPEPLRWIGTNLGLQMIRTADDVEGRTGRPARRAEVFGRFIGA